MPYEVTRRFEKALCEYTGAPYAVAVNSGTMALFLACKLYKDQTTVTLPSRTYVSVPMAVINAGHKVAFNDYKWKGAYRLAPLPIWDSARRFTGGMCHGRAKFGDIHCLSFAASKILGVEQGGAILHGNSDADKWFRKMRFDGRTEGVNPLDDTFDLIGHHCIMLPSLAAQLLLKLSFLPTVNEDMPDYLYPDLSLHSAFK
jgi:dTDP-4-amino-4,6-dideoxygalactose transaminase